jgi:glycosyltransferase involved in cell wall biosynthesis
VRRTRIPQPLAISVHGGDLLAVAEQSPAGAQAVRGALGHAAVVLANSAGMERRARRFGAANTRVVHLGSDLPDAHGAAPARLVTVGHLIARKRHADVLRALWLLRDAHPAVEWVVVGDGPEREPLQRLAAELGLAERVRFTGALPHERALEEARRGGVFVLPSVEEAFGVAYVEAMAGAVPAIGCRGEDGPEEIAAAGDGIRLVAPGDPEDLARELGALLEADDWRHELGAAARATVERAFTWDACGRATVAAYEEALRA